MRPESEIWKYFTPEKYPEERVLRNHTYMTQKSGITLSVPATRHGIILWWVCLALLWLMLGFGPLNLVCLAEADGAPAITENDEVGSGNENQESEGMGDDLIDLSLEELLEVEISSGSLTKTTKRLNPSTMTRITQQDIQNSGARSLYEVLDIFVPNFQIIRQNHQIRHMGLRGITFTRDDKYLLLVNGRIMNEHTNFGVISERDLPTMGDIHHIDVVRGPGSAMYGPGAIAMVINLVTENSTTFQGAEFKARGGYIEEFYSTEAKYGFKLDDDSGVFLYAGVSKYNGADVDDAPLVAAEIPVVWRGKVYQPGDLIEDGVLDDNRTYSDWLRMKFHGQYTNGGFDFWVRYTQGGEHFSQVNNSVGGNGNTLVPNGDGYQQVTAYTSYKQEISPDFSMEYAFSFDATSIENPEETANKNKRYREDEYYGRIVAKWTPAEHHSLALGYEHSHEEFGLDAFHGSVSQLYKWNSITPNGELPRWSTDLGSAFGEYQWNIDDQWTTFAGIRFDKHRFTELMVSPRAVVVWTPTDADTAKVMLSQSRRTNNADEMKRTYDDDSTPDKSDTERLRALEVRYERQQDENWWFGTSYFYHHHNLIGYAGATKPVGTMRSWGLEAEVSFRTEQTRIFASHGYTKLIAFSLADGISSVEDSAAPNGFGDDIGNWANNQTKIRLEQDLDRAKKWMADSSLIIYWGYPGARDRAMQAGDFVSKFDLPWSHSVFWNLGLTYDINENATLRFDGHNLLGFVDKDLNKRINWHGPGLIRSHAPSFSMSLTYRF